MRTNGECSGSLARLLKPGLDFSAPAAQQTANREDASSGRFSEFVKQPARWEGAVIVKDRNGAQIEQRCSDRRYFLRTLGATVAVGSAGGILGPRLVYAADTMTREKRDKLTPDQIIELMIRGNERFRKGGEPTPNYIAQQRATADDQYPAAVILSCIDSRAPAEIIMDLGIGDVFNSRVAGNIANADILGSLEFACKAAGAKVVLVMGHTSCGAVKGAIDGTQLGNLTTLLAKIRPAVEATAFEGDRSSKNLAFVDAVATKNVELTMDAIRANSAVLFDLESTKAIKIVGAMYNLETGKVAFSV
jgi:carbonic anhydrase